MAESFGVEGRGSFYDGVGCLRDVVQNHLLHMVCLLAMEPPISSEPDALRDETVKVMKTIRPLKSSDYVRGQYAGYRDEPGVAAGLRHGDLLRPARAPGLLALGRRAVLHPCGQGDGRDGAGGGRRAAAAAAPALRRPRSPPRAERAALPHEARRHDHARDAGQAAGQQDGQPPGRPRRGLRGGARRRGSRGLPAPAGRCARRRPAAVRAPGRRRGRLARRRPRAREARSGSALRARLLGAGRGDPRAAGRAPLARPARRRPERVDS